MIDTTGQCSACGQTVGIDTIHTCSPQVTAPTPERRVGEARLSAEWVRVISEDGAVLGSWLAEGGTKLRSEVVESEAAKFLALDLLDERAAVTRLTAEVDRLRSVKSDNDILTKANIRSGLALVAARAEIERLRKIIQEAYYEGRRDEAQRLGSWIGSKSRNTMNQFSVSIGGTNDE